MSYVELRANLHVRPGQLEGFKTQVAEIVRLAREHDTETLRFDWFLSADGTQCEVHEAYKSEAGFFAHAQHIMAARAKLFEEFADDHHVTAYGEMPRQIAAMAPAHAGGLAHYSFLQGFESEPMV